MMRLVLVCLLLTSCTVALEQSDNKPIVRTEKIRIYNLGLCHRAYSKAALYFYRNGLELIQSDDADVALTCFQSIPLWMRMFNILPNVQGRGVWQSSYVNVTGDDEYDSKLIVHELSHILLSAPHRARGVMFPESNLGCTLATGLDSQTKSLIK